MRQALTILAVGIGFTATFVAGINLGANLKSEPAQIREPATTQQKISTLKNAEENKPTLKPPQANPANKTPPKITSTKKTSILDRPNWLSASLAKIRPQNTAPAKSQTPSTENNTSSDIKSSTKNIENVLAFNKKFYAIETIDSLNTWKLTKLTNKLKTLNYNFSILDEKSKNDNNYKFIRISGFRARNVAVKAAADLSSKTGQTFIAFRIPAATN